MSRSELLLEVDQWKVPEVPLLADGNFKVPEEVATSYHKLRERHSKARVPALARQRERERDKSRSKKKNSSPELRGLERVFLW